MLQGKNVVLGISGGIAAYKACELISLLKSAGAGIDCIMTRSAAEFITPLTLGTLTQRPVVADMFSPPADYEIEHISLAKKADIIVIAPATANVIGKLACGIADDMLTTTVLATRAPVLIAPAMNTNMYENPVVQENIGRLKDRGFLFADPAEGRLACGDRGRGKLAPVEDIFHEIMRAIACQKDLAGKRVLVTAGPTRERLDPVRFLTNGSTGKMGYAIAQAAVYRGAEVTLVSGPVSLDPPYGAEVVPVESALDMEREVVSRAKGADVIIKSAAVGDFRPVDVTNQKIKKDAGGTVSLTRTPDILAELGGMGLSAVLVGFSMETQDLIQNSAEKLKKKNVDLIVANDLNTAGAGFGTDTNVASLLKRDGTVLQLPKMSKYSLAHVILDEAVRLYEAKQR